MDTFKQNLSDEIMLTDAAVQQMLSIVNSEEGITGVRIYLTGGGCSGLSYGMTLVDAPTKYDAIWSKNDLNVYIDAVALSFLEGVEIDFQVEGLNQSFVFNNVFARTGGSGACGGCASAAH